MQVRRQRGERFWQHPPVGRGNKLGIRHTARYECVLGTGLELQLLVNTPEAGRDAEAAVLREVDRLEIVFSAYWPGQRAAPLAAEPRRIGARLARTGRGAPGGRGRGLVRQRLPPRRRGLDPAVVGGVRTRRRAGCRGPRASRRNCARPSGTWTPGSGQPGDGPVSRCIRTPSPKALSSIAPAEAAMRQTGVRAALVNIGGDVRHAGEKSVPVIIADPFAPQDNAPSFATVQIGNQGIATSGDYRRGLPDRRALVFTPARSTDGLPRRGRRERVGDHGQGRAR